MACTFACTLELAMVSSAFELDRRAPIVYACVHDAVHAERGSPVPVSNPVSVRFPPRILSALNAAADNSRSERELIVAAVASFLSVPLSGATAAPVADELGQVFARLSQAEKTIEQLSIRLSELEERQREPRARSRARPTPDRAQNVHKIVHTADGEGWLTLAEAFDALAVEDDKGIKRVRGNVWSSFNTNVRKNPDLLRDLGLEVDEKRRVGGNAKKPARWLRLTEHGD